MDMPPPPPGAMIKRSVSVKRTLPPVPVEPQKAQPTHLSTDNSITNTASNGNTSLATEKAQPASTTQLTSLSPSTSSSSSSTSSSSKAPAPAAGTGGSIYTLPLWSATPLHAWSIEVMKDGSMLSTIPLRDSSHFLLGRQEDICDIVLDHLSVSRRHAVLQFHENGSLWIYDLGAAHGTFRNKKRLPAHTFVQLDVGDLLEFGASTRLYLIEGPEEFRPREIDRDAIEKHRAAHRQAAATAVASAQAIDSKESEKAIKEDEGVSWGQAEDAVDSDEEDEKAKMLTSAQGGGDVSLPDKLTPQQQKMKEKLDKLRDRLSNLTNEIDTLRAKDIRQGGLTEGQEAQVSKNEQRVESLAQEIQNLEEQLQESITRVSGDREKNRSALESRQRKGKKKGGDSDDDDADADSEDDDFYDRTRVKSTPTTNTSSKDASTTSTSILSSFSPLSALTSVSIIAEEMKRIEKKRDQLRATLQEVVMAEMKSKQKVGAAASSPASSDSLDSFMSGIASDQLSQRKTQIKSSLSELQTHYIKLQRLQVQRKGEEVRQRYLEGDTEAFKKAAAEDAAAAEEAKKHSGNPSITPAAEMEVDSTESKVKEVGPALPSGKPKAPATAAGGTADMLARLKKKQKSDAKKEEVEELRRVAQQKEEQARVAANVRAFESENASSKPMSTEERIALLASQMSEARSQLHRAYDTVPEDEVSRRLKESAARSKMSLDQGVTVAPSDRGGLLVRKREGDDELNAKRQKLAAASEASSYSSSSYASDSTMQVAEPETTVEWVPPTQAAAGQDKLRAKFAGKY